MNALAIAVVKFKWIITYGGGRNGRRWEGAMEVKATDIRSAIDAAEPEVREAGGVILSVDYNGEITP